MTWYVRCGCGNMVESKHRHDFSVLPCPDCRSKGRTVQKKEDFPLYWRTRKKLAIWHHHLMKKLFMGYVLRQNAKRKGSCDGCKFTWLCCIGCSKYDPKTKKCTDYKNRPFGCVVFPIDRFQTMIMGAKCNMRWDD